MEIKLSQFRVQRIQKKNKKSENKSIEEWEKEKNAVFIKCYNEFHVQRLLYSYYVFYIVMHNTSTKSSLNFLLYFHINNDLKQ